MPIATLERYYTPLGTWGELQLPGFSCATIARPWLNNEPFKSCIPEGEYRLGLRRSDVVARSTRSEFDAGWEVKDVTGRSWIMVHPANYVHELQGCIAPGREHVVMAGRIAVNHSVDTFRLLMAAMDEQEWMLQVRGYRP
jgi:hypothetical protein